MVKGTVQPRGSRWASFLSGLAAALGLAALAAAVSPLGPPLDFQVVDRAAFGASASALASHTVPLGGPLWVPSIGVVAPGLDAFAALNGPPPPSTGSDTSASYSPYTPEAAGERSTAPADSLAAAAPTDGPSGASATTPPVGSTGASLTASPSDSTSPATTIPAATTTGPVTTGPVTTDPVTTDPVTTAGPTTTDPGSAGPPTTPTTTPTTPDPALPACATGLPIVGTDPATGGLSLIDPITGAAVPVVDPVTAVQLTVIDPTTWLAITIDPAIPPTIVVDPTTGAPTYYALDPCAPGAALGISGPLAPMAVLVTVTPTDGSPPIPAYVPLDPVNRP